MIQEVPLTLTLSPSDGERELSRPSQELVSLLSNEEFKKEVRERETTAFNSIGFL